MKKWILFGLSLLALTASLALSACGTTEQQGQTQSGQPTQPSETPPTQPESGQGGTTEGGTGGTGSGQ